MLCTIIGAGPGLGAALAERFASGGCDVAMVSRSPDRLRRWRSEQPHPTKLATFSADAADSAQLDQAFEDIHAWRGDTEILIYNVADLTPGAIEELTTEQLLASMRTNVGGLLDSFPMCFPGCASEVAEPS